MKARQIEIHLHRLLLDLAGTHKPIAHELLQETVVTGGCIASLLLKEPVNDYDIYFKSQKALAKVLDYFNGLMDAGTNIAAVYTHDVGATKGAYRRTIFYATCDEIKDILDTPALSHIGLNLGGSGQWSQPKTAIPEGKKYWPIFASQNALTLSDKVQLVFRFTGSPEEIHKNYDFVHATNYFTTAEGLVLNTDACAALMARELIYRGSRYPLASIFRTRKFIKRGWNIHIANYVKMAMQLNAMDLTDLHTLRDQLTGVDAAYLGWIIKKCEAEGAVTESYVCELVDRIMTGRGEGEFDEDEPENENGD